jgi:hypothetical protein
MVEKKVSRKVQNGILGKWLLSNGKKSKKGRVEKRGEKGEGGVCVWVWF